MKNVIKISIAMCLLISTSAKGQTFSEWFRQGKTQRKYLLEQIAALKVYIEGAHQGYRIAQDGLNLIGDIKNGDFNLHNNYFNSLKSVNPVVKKYSRILDIIVAESDILQIYRKLKSALQNGQLYSIEETQYMLKLINQVIDRSATCLEEVAQTITEGELEMTDEQRLRRIDAIYIEMNAHLRAMNGCSTQTGIDMLIRERELGDIELLRRLYGY